MRWLLLAIIFLAQQPTEAPEGKGTAKSNNAQSTAHTESTKSKQTPSTQSAPIPTQAPIATESQRSGATAKDHSGLWVCAKRLEKGRFTWPQSGDAQGKVVLGHEELSLLLGGIDLSKTKHKRAIVPRSRATVP
ncbi:MAG: transposase [Acidobacteriia bacterium]|nr:transposase [Terriglobia bacterium]